MLAFFTALFAVLLYATFMHLVPKGTFEPWVIAASLNTGLALLVAFFYRPNIEASKTGRLWAWALPPLVLLGTLVLVLLAGGDPNQSAYASWEILGLIIWVPVIEEIIFRRGLHTWVSHRFPKFCSIYLSALLFAFAHAEPPMFWPPLGPFLLGLLAAWCYQVTGRLLVPILLHMACNASAYLFAVYAPELLDSLSWLYQRL